jgi:myo-inositol 2-dehydrogenase/D-chiro-inositol 1-dehydrogenase
VRLGLIGCGRLASFIHLPELRNLPNAVLVAAADPEPAARSRAGPIAGVPVHENAEQLLGRDDVDAVIICAPTPLHAELAVATAAARKHLYLEKPIAATLEDGRRVVDAVERAGVVAAIGFNRRRHPLFEQAREILAGGRIGAVRAVHMAFCEPTPPEVMPAWKRRRDTGGGVLLDLASHHVDLLRWFLDDEVETVNASVTSEISEGDAAWLQARMRGGAETHGFYSFRAGFADFLEFQGERGSLRVDRHRPSIELRVARRWGYGLRRAWPPPTIRTTIWRLERLVRPGRDPSYRRSLHAFVERLRGAAVALPSLSDGMRSLEAIVAAESSVPAAEATPVANRWSG